MRPTRQKLVGKIKVEEYKFGGPDDTLVFVDAWLVNETYDQAVARLETEES